MTPSPAGSFRTLAARLWRVLWPLGIVAGGAITCDAPTNPGRRGTGYIAVSPVYSLNATGNFSGLTVDQVRITVVRPPADTLARVTIPFSVDSTQVTARIPVEVVGSENLDVTIEMLAGAGPAAQVVFTGSQTVQAVQGSNTTPTTPVPVTFVGPGTQIATLQIQPRDSGTIFGASVPFRVTAFDSQNVAVPQFYVSWSTSSSAHVINANGVFTAGNTRGTVWVYAKTPTGIKDSTRITISPVATQLQLLAGNSQTGALGTALPAPLSVRVLAADNLPVAGVPITFSVVSGGGSVAPVSAATDSLGVASTIATLGPATGANSFRAAAPGLAPVTFTATASSAPGVPVAVTIVAGNGQSLPAGTAVPVLPRVRVIDGLGVRVGGVSVTFAVVSGGGSITGASTVTDTAGFAQVGSWTLGTTPGANSLSATVTGLTPAIFTATGTAGPVIQLSLPGNLVGVGAQSALAVKLTQPAPAGGVTVTVTSDSTQYVTVTAPGTIAFAAGDTVKAITLNGVATGATLLHATAPGYTAGVLAVGAVPNIIVLQSNVTVPVSASTSVGITLVPAAPVGGLTVSLASTDTTIAKVTTPTVTIAAGQSTGTAVVMGVATGIAGITATAPAYAGGGTVVTVGSGAVPTALTQQAGNNQTAYINDTTAIRPVALVVDQFDQPLPGVQVLFTVASGGGTIAGGAAATATTNASGLASPAGTWKMGPAAGSNVLVASIPAAPTVPPVNFTATGQLPPPLIQLNVFGSNVVGQARTGQLDVHLLQAAPAGGLTVTLVSTRTGLLRIGSYTSENGSAVFAAGDTLQSVVVFGDSTTTGVDTVIATAPGYTPDTLAVPISINLISLPLTLNVPLSQTVSLGINLSTPAPLGGVQVAVSSNNPAVAVTTPTVTVPQGATVVSAGLRGDALGSATVTATNPNYAPFSSNVSVTASLNIIQTTASLNASFGTAVVVQLESNALPVSAPAGGVAVTMTPRNAACAAASSTTIPAGLVSTSVPITYGGSATLPCSTYIVASGPAGFVIDSVLANVAVQPALSGGTTNIGAGLQRNLSVSLGASNHGGTVVHLVSSNAAKLLLSLNATTPGSAAIDLPIGLNGTSAAYYIQGVEGVIADTVTITATAPGFVNGTWQVRVWQPVLDVVNLATTATTLDVNRAIYARVWTPSSPTGTQSSNDEIRAGGTPITVTFGLSDSTVARLVSQTPGRADSATVTIPVLGTSTPTTLATGGVEFDVLGAGTVTTSAASPVTRSVATALGVTTVVSAPQITVPTVNIGAGLQRATTGSLGASQHGGVTVHLVSADPAEALLSLNATTPGTASIDIPVANGTSNYSFFVQGVEGRIADTSVITATVPGFATGTGAVRVWQPVLDVVNLSTTATTLDVNRAIYARVWTPTSPTGTQSSNDEIRAGGTPITVTFGLSDSTVARLVSLTAGRADSASATIPVLGATTPTSLATSGVEFDVVGAGSVITSAASPVTRSVGTALGVTTVVSAPLITAPTINIGSGLQRNTSGSLGAAQHGGVTVHLVSADPAEALLSPNATTPGTATLDIAVPNGSTTFSFFVQGVEGRIADTSVITATAPGFTPVAGAVRVWQAIYDMVNVSATATSLDADRPFYARLWTPTGPATNALSSNDEIRAGGTPLTATFTTSQATVAQLVSSTQSGSQATAQIAVGLANTPTTVAAGGVSLDYLTAGQTAVKVNIPGLRYVAAFDSALVTVTAPSIAVNVVTVGAGLQSSASGSLSTGAHGGVDVVVSSSNPQVALVSPNATTPGTPSITVHLNNGQTTVSYVVQGVEGLQGPAQQVTIRLQAPGFTDGTATASIVQPALVIAGLVATGSAATAADDPFVVQVGIPNGTLTGLLATQAVRAGAPGPLTVTVTSDSTAFGLLKAFGSSTGVPSLTVDIPIGQAQSPNNAAGGALFDFVAPGVTFVVPTAAGYLTMQQSVAQRPGFQVTVTP